jgi:hypothetical protein
MNLGPALPVMMMASQSSERSVSDITLNILHR